MLILSLAGVLPEPLILMGFCAVQRLGEDVCLLLRVGVALVLAEGFRLFLSFVLGPVLDMFVNQSINGFKAF